MSRIRQNVVEIIQKHRRKIWQLYIEIEYEYAVKLEKPPMKKMITRAYGEPGTSEVFKNNNFERETGSHRPQR